jgi:hypothetical protein
LPRLPTADEGAIGLFAISDAAFPGRSGEQAPFGTQIAVIFDLPIGLIMAALAFTQRKGRRRKAFFVIASIVLLMPLATDAVRRTRNVLYLRALL